MCTKALSDQGSCHPGLNSSLPEAKNSRVFLWFSNNISLQCRRPGFDTWVGDIPWKREQLCIPVFWPGEFHGLYGPWGCKESEMTEWLSLQFRGLSNCLHIFLFFILLSFSYFHHSLPAHSSVSLPQLFCYWFLPVHFHFSYCTDFHWLFVL